MERTEKHLEYRSRHGGDVKALECIYFADPAYSSGSRRIVLMRKMKYIAETSKQWNTSASGIIEIASSSKSHQVKRLSCQYPWQGGIIVDNWSLVYADSCSYLDMNFASLPSRSNPS